MVTEIFFICLIAGLVLIGGEIFVPGGILGAIGAILLLVAIVDGFIAFPAAGPYVALGIVVFVGIAFVLWIKLFPRTRMGRTMTVETDLRTFKATESGLKELVGHEGIAVSQLRPAGYVMIDGRRVDVVTRGEMIAKASPVKVLAVEGNSVIVARTDVQA